ncbi:MAG: ABC transporter permease [Anaerolineae bacterium]|nr:ABC transporter permease [Anaerolineae bacterium]
MTTGTNSADTNDTVVGQQRNRQRTYSLALIVFAVAIAVIVTLAITYRLFAKETFDATMQALTAQPDYQNIVLINILVGVSVGLFIVQLRGIALRVTLTVVFALVLGYGVTAAFNSGAASKYTRGEFRASVVSDAPKAETDQETDLEYGTAKGGEFNKPKVRDPLTEAKYTFAGKQGDIVNVLAYAANRRSEVDLMVALLDPQGVEIASATTATEEQIEQFDDKLRSTKDAIIPNFTLPADGIYTVDVRPEPVSAGTTFSEMTKATNLAYEAFLLGPLGRPNRWAVWIQDAVTLTFLGLAVAIVFRARQFYLGGEGQIYMGALVSGMIALASGNLPPAVVIPLCIAAAMLAGFLWGLIPGVLKAYLGANELVSSLMLNTVATRFFEMVLNFQLKPPTAGFIASATFPASGQLPVLVADTAITISVFLVIIAMIGTWLLMSRTSLGYEIRMVGSNQKFAAYGGINTKRVIMLSMAISGIIAGLAGAHLSMGIFRQLVLNMSANLIFEGVVVALLARNNPLVIPFTGLLYAYLRAGAQFMERDANVSFEVVRIIQAVIILLITAEALVTLFQSRRGQRKQQQAAAPQAEVKPASA